MLDGWRFPHQSFETTAFAPLLQPNHLLGIGDLESVELCLPMGFDTFDSAFPTRAARHGTVFTQYVLYCPPLWYQVFAREHVYLCGRLYDEGAATYPPVIQTSRKQKSMQQVCSRLLLAYLHPWLLHNTGTGAWPLSAVYCDLRGRAMFSRE
jgi:hypothetical protein